MTLTPRRRTQQHVAADAARPLVAIPSIRPLVSATPARPFANVNAKRPTIVVAIPARDEADRIAACLEALDRQTTSPDAVVVVANNCADNTEDVARSVAPRFQLDVISEYLPPDQASAGLARRSAMAHAAERASEGGIVLTTDADGTAPPDWVQRNLAALLAGADCVCGQSLVEAVEAEFIPQHLHDDDVLERRLAGLIDQMAWLLDPDPADPLPRHQEDSGASLGVWVTALRRAGGVPPLRAGEDRAFVAALRGIDAWVRHDPHIFVTVSGRLDGRAAGGMADAIRRRIVQQDEFTDATLEPAADALRRLTLRARARSVWERPRADRTLAAKLAIEPGQLEKALLRPFFGAAWHEIEASSSVLARRRRVRFCDLPRHIQAAELLVESLQHCDIPPSDSLAAD